MKGAECEALVALYNATGGSSWANRANWLVTRTPCDWKGVTCESGHVADLKLRGNYLSGPIPPDLGRLRKLHSLDLMSNH